MNTSSQDSALSPLLRWLDQRQDRVAALQGDLTAFRALGPENGGEGELAKALYIEDCLRACGVSDIRRLDAADPRVPSGLRPNVVARIPGRSSRTLWLFAHMDVVPPGDPALWHSDPWQVVRQGDMLVGRGVEDNQQGLVSMLLLAEALHTCDITPELSLGLVFMADEECGNDYGLAHVLERHAALPEEQRFLRADDFYIVPDSGSPTGADIEVAEKCLCWLKVDVSGVQCHASTPHKGRNAFVAGAAAVLACMELHKDFPRRDALFDPACSTFVPSRHDANVPSVNILPGHDSFYVDCRLLPGVEPEHVLDAARRRLMDILCNYAGYKKCIPILVFDAYRVSGGAREVEKHHNLYVVYTREAETADMYIERATHELAKEHRTRVVSSDGAEQIIVMGHGALRVSARAIAEEVAAVEKEIRAFLEG